jgi:hypothetical protein
MPEANMYLNKRSSPRVPVHIPVTFLVMKEHKEIKDIRELIEKTKTAETLDASLGGMMLAGDQALNRGDILTIKFSIPSRTTPLSAFAEVVWIKEAGAGLRFLSLREEDAKSLEVYLQNFSSGNEGPGKNPNGRQAG